MEGDQRVVVPTRGSVGQTEVILDFGRLGDEGRGALEVVNGAEHFAAVEGARPAPVQHGTLPGAATGDQRDAAGERGDQNNAGDTSGHLYWIAIRAITGR